MKIQRKAYYFSKIEFIEDNIIEYLISSYPKNSVMSMTNVVGNSGEGFKVTFSTFS